MYVAAYLAEHMLPNFVEWYAERKKAEPALPDLPCALTLPVHLCLDHST